MNIERNRIYTGDCVEIMKSFPDKCIDCVITDPPYELEAHTMQRRVRRGCEPLPFEPITEKLRCAVSNEIARLTKRWALVFCQVEASHKWHETLESAGMVYKRTMIWIKPDGMPQYTGDRPGMGYESIVAVHATGKSTWNGGGRHGVFIQNKSENRRIANDHPTQKPLRLMQTLCRLFGNDGCTILDPFCGSGTTLVATLQTGSQFIGIEINPDYVQIAEQRIARERAQLKLAL